MKLIISFSPTWTRHRAPAFLSSFILSNRSRDHSRPANQHPYLFCSRYWDNANVNLLTYLSTDSLMVLKRKIKCVWEREPAFYMTAAWRTCTLHSCCLWYLKSVFADESNKSTTYNITSNMVWGNLTIFQLILYLATIIRAWKYNRQFSQQAFVHPIAGYTQV